MLTVLDLFSGVGGFPLGLERTGGFKTIAFCEIDPFCRRVLAKHWPGVPIYEDVKTLSLPTGFSDVVCGGFPCQDLSAAGRGAGIEGKRSGLWSELCRIIGEVRPRYAIVENVPRLLGGGDGAWMGKVLGDLASVGYDAEWHCIPASAVGAPHIRDRVWIIANPQYPDTDSKRPHRAPGNLRAVESRNEQSRYAGSLGALLADTPGEQSWRIQQREFQSDIGAGREDVADSKKLHGYGGEFYGEHRESKISQLGNSHCEKRGRHGWSPEPDVGRVAHGVPLRVDRLRSLGNSVVPAITQILGRAILEAEGAVT